MNILTYFQQHKYIFLYSIKDIYLAPEKLEHSRTTLGANQVHTSKYLIKHRF